MDCVPLDAVVLILVMEDMDVSDAMEDAADVVEVAKEDATGVAMQVVRVIVRIRDVENIVRQPHMKHIKTNVRERLVLVDVELVVEVVAEIVKAGV